MYSKYMSTTRYQNQHPSHNIQKVKNLFGKAVHGYRKGREGKGSKLWLGCERCLSVVKSNGGKIKVKYGCVSS
jgi:hypothetical protein